jgi:NADH dehydrogenase
MPRSNGRKRLKQPHVRERVQVTLVSRDNFFLFTPMLHEVAASDLDPSHIVNPLHKLLSRVDFFLRRCRKDRPAAKSVRVSHGAPASGSVTRTL